MLCSSSGSDKLAATAIAKVPIITVILLAEDGAQQKKDLVPARRYFCASDLPDGWVVV